MTEGARISELKRPVNPDLIAQLHELLAEAESGELVGAVVLLHIAGGQYRCHCVGESEHGPNDAGLRGLEVPPARGAGALLPELRSGRRMTWEEKRNTMSTTTNYARHVGRPALPAEPGTAFKPWERRKGKVVGTREVVFFSGAAPAQCVPQEEWAFYRRPWPPEPFAGRIVGESGT